MNRRDIKAVMRDIRLDKKSPGRDDVAPGFGDGSFHRRGVRFRRRGHVRLRHQRRLGRRQLLLVSDEQLEAMSGEAWGMALKENKQVSNPAMRRQVESVGSRIVQAADRKYPRPESDPEKLGVRGV